MADSQKYDRTAQLLDKDNIVDGGAFYPDLFTNKMTASNNTVILLLPCKSSTTYTISRRNVITHRFSMCFLTSDEIYAGMPTYGSIGNDAGFTLASTSTAESRYLCFYYGKKGGSDSSTPEEIQSQLAEIMINEGGTALPYEPYLDWQHSLRKLTTATEAVENPLYSDGTAITAYTIKGNTVQNGTPIPDNPVDANGVGVRTENLVDDLSTYTNGYINSSGNLVGQSATNLEKTSLFMPIPSGTTELTLSSKDTFPSGANGVWIAIACYSSNTLDSFLGRRTSSEQTVTYGIPEGTKYARVSLRTYGDTVYCMLNTGSTALPYEPYGYKIPISNGQQTTNIYLGSTASIRNVKKAMFSGGDSEGWYLQSINSYGIANFALNSAISPLKWIDTQRLLWVCNRFLPQSSLIADTNTEGIMLNQYNACFVRINSSTVSTTAAFKTWLRNNPIVVYYVLANAETAAVNEPLMKIGDYADTVSNAMAIPATEGANSITVDTTVQPSEFTATWTGWHDSSVKEWDGSQWNE